MPCLGGRMLLVMTLGLAVVVSWPVAGRLLFRLGRCRGRRGVILMGGIVWMLECFERWAERTHDLWMSPKPSHYKRQVTQARDLRVGCPSQALDQPHEVEPQDNSRQDNGPQHGFLCSWTFEIRWTSTLKTLPTWQNHATVGNDSSCPSQRSSSRAVSGSSFPPSLAPSHNSIRIKT